MAEKMFVHIAKKTSFTSELQSKYTNSIVFIKDTQEIWTHGTFYAIPEAYKNKITSLESAVEALQSAYGFNTISDGKNSAQAQAGATTIKFTGTNGTTVTVGTGGVTIDSKDYTEDIADAKKAGTDASDALGTYKTTNDAAVKAAQGDATKALSDAADAKTQADKGVADAAAALAEAQKKVTSVTSGSNAIGVTTGTTPAVSLKVSATQGENVTVTQETDGLKVNVDLSDYAKSEDIPTVSYPVTGVVSTDKVLSMSGTQVMATLDLKYENNRISLKGKSGAEIAGFDASAFVKDSFLSDVDYDDETHDLTFTFNTEENGAEEITVNLEDLVDTYDGANLNLSTSYADRSSYTAANVKTGASLDVVVSELKAGVAKAIADAASAIANAGVTKFGDKTGEITVKSGSTTNGTVNFSMSGNELNGTVYGLKSAAYTDSTEYATSAQGTKADSALQTIGKGTDGTYVTTTVSTKASNNQNVSVALTYGNYTTPTNGVAKVEDTKAYIDGLFAWEEL